MKRKVVEYFIVVKMDMKWTKMTREYQWMRWEE